MSFPLGAKDVLSASLIRNNFPGPGTHDHIGMRTHTFNKVYLGERDAEVRGDKSVPIIDNGVPGPQKYNPKNDLAVPNFKICKNLPETKEHKAWKESTIVKNPPGPQTYSPSSRNNWRKGTRFSVSMRSEEKGSF